MKFWNILINILIFWNLVIETFEADVKGVREQYNCQGKPDGTECYCPPRIVTCTPKGGARCKQGTCARGTTDISDADRMLEQYNCQGKPDGTECYCLFRIVTCTPRGGARCSQGTCTQGNHFWWGKHPAV